VKTGPAATFDETDPRASVPRPGRRLSALHDDDPLASAGVAPPGDAASQQRLVRALHARLRAKSDRVRLVETHISYVLLTGDYAYKIKKAVRLGFLDFSTLDRRRRFCDEELRLNRRFAAALYLDVVAITGTPGAPVLGGSGPILDYAVRMRQFPDRMLLADLLDRHELTSAHVDALAASVADFHARAAIARVDARHGASDSVLAPALANFIEMAPLVWDASDRTTLDALEDWTRREHAAIRDALDRRRRDGMIRECHGDLHLGNIALVDGELTIFDCIEFNEAMRWIDTMSDAAFTVMDLEHRARADLAYRFLTAYLERSGDYAAAAVLRFYLVYRALVRAKVARLRASQRDRRGRASPGDEGAGYLRLASSYALEASPAIVLMHGFSGSGKTTLAQAMVERGGAIRIRTDVERKRLAGLAAGASSGSMLASGLYASDATRRTYERVAACADAVVQGGFAAIVDAASLQRWQRDLLRERAAQRGVPFVIVDCVASAATLRARVTARALAGTDASEAGPAVLEHQLRTAEPLARDELAFTIACDADAPVALSRDAWLAFERPDRQNDRGSPSTCSAT
jgi:aminoglycoside phosphotransferase family enzyme/predicted kinase